MTRGGFGARSDITLIGAPLLDGGEFEDPACARPENRHHNWDYQEKGAVAGLRGQGDPAALAEVRAMFAVCGGCVHVEDCRDHAIEAGEPVGVWGATVPSQRQAIRRLRGLA